MTAQDKFDFVIEFLEKTHNAEKEYINAKRLRIRLVTLAQRFRDYGFITVSDYDNPVMQRIVDLLAEYEQEQKG
jgi:hypothetical protein